MSNDCFPDARTRIRQRMLEVAIVLRRGGLHAEPERAETLLKEALFFETKARE